MSDQGDYLRKVQPGERLRGIPREAYNAFVDAAIANRQGPRMGEKSQGWSYEPGIITVRNSSGADQDRFAILEVSDSIIDPGENEVEWTREVALEGTLPSGEDVPFCVLLEPLADGGVGKAVISGATWCYVERSCEEHSACGPAEGNTDALVSGNSGPARILYLSTTGDGDAKLAYVLLGSTVDGCNANGCGSPAWTECRKRVTDVRCTSGGIEYDAEFDYYDCQGRLLFTSDEPCDGSGSVTHPNGVTFTLDGAGDGTCTNGDCDSLNRTYVLTRPNENLFWWTGSFVVGIAAVCGESLMANFYYESGTGLWILEVYLNVGGVGGTDTILRRWERSGSATDTIPMTLTHNETYPDPDVCDVSGWPTEVTVEES